MEVWRNPERGRDFKEKNMSTYYNINGLKVRVSDHEPNSSLRGSSDLELYTKSACNQPLSVINQIEAYCEKKDLDILMFEDVIKDFPDHDFTFEDIKKMLIK